MKNELPLSFAGFPVRATLTGVVIVYLLFEPAHAYVDPGTGAMVLQLAAAALAGAAFYFRAFRSWFWSLFRRDRGDTTEVGDHTAGTSDDK